MHEKFTSGSITFHFEQSEANTPSKATSFSESERFEYNSFNMAVSLKKADLVRFLNSDYQNTGRSGFKTSTFNPVWLSIKDPIKIETSTSADITSSRVITAVNFLLSASR